MIIDLRHFFRDGNYINRIDILSFHRTPTHVGLFNSKGQEIFIVSTMKDLSDGTELGILQFANDLSPSGHKSALNETWAGGNAIAVEYLTPPGFDSLAGVRILFDSCPLIVTSGEMPYSLYVQRGDLVRGRPEFNVEEYTRL